jgi:peptide alpha-N-acetyltransferase
VFVAADRQVPVGFLACRKRKSGTALAGAIELMAVDRRFTRRGFGTSLTKAFLEFCVDVGCEVGEVGTQSHNVGAIRLYEKCGFRLDGSFYSFHWHV